MERYRPTPLVKQEESVDVKVAKFTRKLDLVQIAAGGVIFVAFSKAIGLGLIAFNGVSYWITGKYIERRTKGKDQLPSRTLQPQAAMAA